MSIVIRAADLTADKTVLIDTMQQFLTPQSDEQRFNWLYLQNPFGPARVWIAMDEARTNSVIGMASAFPRRLYLNGQDQLGWVLGDFCLDLHYRSLGPAVQLQRVFLAEVAAGTMNCFYDFPSTGMMAVYRRLRVPETGAMVRLAKPLRIDRKVREFVKVPLIDQGISMTGNFLLRLTDGVSSPSRDLECSLQQHLCGEEFTALAQRVASQWGIHIDRSAAYLNWRFLSNPLSRHEMLTIRSQDRLVGYAVFTHTGDNGTLIDLFGQTDPKILGGLVKALLRLLRKRGVVTVSAPLYSAHPLMSTLLELGFKKRESTPVVIYRASHLRNRVNETNGTAWNLTSGDRDS